MTDIARLSKGSEKQFAFGEIKSNAEIIRIDSFLHERAERILADMRGDKQEGANVFCGLSFGSFEGVLKAVDLRGDTQSAYLILRAGGKQISCVVNNVPREELRTALDSRVRISGRAHYEVKSQLPVRFDIQRIEIIPTTEAADLALWRGAFSWQDDRVDAEGWA